MNQRLTAAVLTISDKGFRGERADTSGPALRTELERAGWEVVHAAILPDDQSRIQEELIRCADELSVSLVLTTGGTGFSPRDITPEATLAVVEREAPGLPEAMRAESMRITPRGCLSRSAAGIRGRTLIVNLPGSERAARENLLAVLSPLRHGVEMLLSQGSADCAQAPKAAPSLDEWLREAKAAPGAAKIGTYLIHQGVVRETSRASVREGRPAAPVLGMRFSSDPEKVAAAKKDVCRMKGIHYVRIWLNEGVLPVGAELMYVLLGADIRPHAEEALRYLVDRLKRECVTEVELFSGISDAGRDSR